MTEGDPPFDLPILEPQEAYRRSQEMDPWPGEPYDGESVLAGVKSLGVRPFRLDPALFEALAEGARRSSLVIGEHVNRWQEAILYAFGVEGRFLSLDRPTRGDLAAQRRLATQVRRTERRAARRRRRATRGAR